MRLKSLFEELNMIKIGFIGFGNMARAMVKGLLKSQIYDIIVSNRSPEKLKVAQEWGVRIGENIQVARESDYLILAIKPFYYKEVIEEIKPELHDDTVVISIASGWTLDKLQELLPDQPIARTMPNTPALVGAGVTAFTPGSTLNENQKLEVKAILETFSQVMELPEEQVNAFSALAGCSPAYVFMMIEAMGDAGVKAGLVRKDAYEIAARAIEGSAKLYLETRTHPGELKDMVCTPKGTTIEAVLSLEKTGFRDSLVEAIAAVLQKADKQEKN